MTIRSPFFVAAMGLMLGLSGWIPDAGAAETVMDQNGLKFIPTTLTINAGDSVRFENHDPFTHDVTVTGPDGASIDKGIQQHGKDNVVAFAKQGTFKITCKFHPLMTATVIVK